VRFLDRGTILGQTKRRYLEVNLDGFGTCRFRSLTSSEMRELKSALQNADGSGSKERIKYIAELLLCATLVDEDGNLLFSHEDAFGGCWNEVDGLFRSKAYAAAQKWTGFLDDENMDWLEDAIKNSKTDHPNGSQELLRQS